jgi:hypothetical protein
MGPILKPPDYPAPIMGSSARSTIIFLSSDAALAEGSPSTRGSGVPRATCSIVQIATGPAGTWNDRNVGTHSLYGRSDCRNARRNSRNT